MIRRGGKMARGLVAYFLNSYRVLECVGQARMPALAEMTRK